MQVLKHHEWTSNKTIQTIYQTDTANEFFKFHSSLKTNNNPTKIIDALTRITDIKVGAQDHKATVSGNSILAILNKTGVTQQYAINLQVCITDFATHKVIGCSSNEDQISIEAGNTFQRAVTPTATQTFSAAGKYIVDMTTAVLNANDEPLFISEDFQVISIPAV